MSNLMITEYLDDERRVQYDIETQYRNVFIETQIEYKHGNRWRDEPRGYTSITLSDDQAKRLRDLLVAKYPIDE